MARWGAIPKIFGRVHPQYQSPDVSTLGMGALSIVFTLFLVGFNSSQAVLNDSITALGFAVCFYYGFTGVISATSTSAASSFRSAARLLPRGRASAAASAV